MEEKNFTYIVECSDHSYYTGWTNNLDKRLMAHNSGQGAKYTKSRMPVRLVYYEAFGTKQEAMRREYEIKQCSRRKKQRLIEELSSADRKKIGLIQDQAEKAKRKGRSDRGIKQRRRREKEGLIEELRREGEEKRKV